MCPTCGTHNFANRTNCKNCNVPKPGMAGSGYSNVLPDNAGLVPAARALSKVQTTTVHSTEIIYVDHAKSIDVLAFRTPL